MRIVPSLLSLWSFREGGLVLDASCVLFCVVEYDVSGEVENEDGSLKLNTTCPATCPA